MNTLMHSMASGGCVTVTQDGGLPGEDTEEAWLALGGDGEAAERLHAGFHGTSLSICVFSTESRTVKAGERVRYATGRRPDSGESSPRKIKLSLLSA